jgi:hypothetical protein
MPSNDFINVDVIDAKSGQRLEEIVARDGTVWIAIEVDQQFRVLPLLAHKTTPFTTMMSPSCHGIIIVGDDLETSTSSD